MNETGGLLRESIVFLWRNPVVLLPVLLARLLDLAVYWLNGLLARPLVQAVAPHSVLGGLSGKVTAPVLIVVNVFTFLPIACEIVLLLYAMVTSARWAHAIRESGPAAHRDWRFAPGEIARASALTFGVGGITTLVGVFFSLRGGVPLRWSYALTWCFLMMASWFLLPSWLRLLARAEEVRYRDPAKVPAFVAVVLGFGLFAACMKLGINLQQSLVAAQRIHGAAAAFAIYFIAACVSTIPLAFSFVALSRYVAERPGWRNG